MVFGSIESAGLIKVAFPLIGGRNWTGGYNYLLNLLRLLGERAANRVTPVLFLGTDLPVEDVQPFLQLPHLIVVRHADFEETARSRRLAEAILTGQDRLALAHFREQGIQVAFEPAQYYGWRFPLPAVAWIPDFQHRHLKHLFGMTAYWKRELGFRAQLWSKRRIMLSSEDARRDCVSFYPASRGFTDVVRFAVPAQPFDSHAARAIADGYGLPEHFFFLPNQFWQHKNHECVIRALHLLKQRGKPVVVAVTGKQEDQRDPQHFPRLCRLIDELGLRNEFRLLGLIPYQHLSALMGCCTALINSSFLEGWSTTVEEAKAAGTPMLLSALPVHREQAEGIASFFDPHAPGELAELLERAPVLDSDSRQERRRLAAELARERTGQFAEEFASLIEHVYAAGR